MIDERVNATKVSKGRERGLQRLHRAFFHSLNGIRQCWQDEEAFRLAATSYLFLLPVALYLGKTPVEKALLGGSLALIVLAELVNSAVEAAIDRIGPEHHPLAGKAKDVASATVMIAVFNALLIWGLLLLT